MESEGGQSVQGGSGVAQSMAGEVWQSDKGKVGQLLEGEGGQSV